MVDIPTPQKKPPDIPPQPTQPAPQQDMAAWRARFEGQAQTPANDRAAAKTPGASPEKKPDISAAANADRKPVRDAAPAAAPDRKPQTPADRKEISDVADRLLKARDEGLVVFGDDRQAPKTHERIDGATARYLKSIQEAPSGTDLPMKPELARVFDKMLTAAEQRRAKDPSGPDFSIMSLVRPDKGHSADKGAGSVDIGTYAHQKLDFTHPDQALKGVAQFYRDIAGQGQGGSKVDTHVAFGIPRNPRMDPAGARAEYLDTGHPEKQRYYDLKHIPEGQVLSEKPYTILAGQPELKSEYLFPDTFFHREAAISVSPGHGVLAGDIAALREPARTEFTKIAGDAGGSVLRYMFPDALDHLHVQVVK